MDNDKRNDNGPIPAGQPPPYSPPQCFDGGYAAAAGYPATDNSTWSSSPPPYNQAFSKRPEDEVGGCPPNPSDYCVGQYVDAPSHYQLQQQTVVIQQPGAMQWIAPSGPLNDPPNDYMCYSVFVTLCCCWLIGIFAIARSAECRAAIAVGDRVTAEMKSREARSKAHLALGLGIASCVLTGIVLGVYYGMWATYYRG